jgi:hypothetical protein
LAKITASASPRCGYQSWGVSLPLKLVVVRTTSWREGVLLGQPRMLPDRSVFTPVSTLYLKNGFKDYQGPTTFRENVIRKYHFPNIIF